MTHRPRPLRILHLHSTFNPGGKEVRSVQLINAFGRDCEHAVVSAMPGAMGAGIAIDRGIGVDLDVEFPELQGRPTPGRLQRLARAMLGHDLVLTYNFGAMDAVMAHTVFGAHFRLPPLVHHEDGFNEDEVRARKPMRNWYRRVALARTAALVVPSRRLETIALAEWHQPRERVWRIPNGIATAAYSASPRRDALPRVIKRDDELWVGTLAGLKPVKNLRRLVRAFARLPEPWQLVIVGDGPERDTIRDEALRLEVSHRVHLPGFVAEPAKVIGLFDLFALSSDSEQFPISVVEAMAAGLAVAATAVGDVAAMLAPENRPFLAAPGDEAGLTEALRQLSEHPELRAKIGAANRALAATDYDEAAMVAAYRNVYARALGQPDFP